MNFDLSHLASELAKRGFHAFVEEEVASNVEWSDRLVCARCRRPRGGYGGTSFWVAHTAREWIIGSWSGAMYALPDTTDVVSLCTDWLVHEFPAGCYDLPKDLQQLYGLRRFDDELR